MAEEDEVERDFPALTRENYQKSSEKDFNYNCLAFVLGDNQNWWEPPGMFGHYWPPGFPEDTTVETVTLIIKTHGFLVDAELKANPETEAIAVYAEGHEWTHFAKFA